MALCPIMSSDTTEITCVQMRCAMWVSDKTGGGLCAVASLAISTRGLAELAVLGENARLEREDKRRKLPHPAT